MKNILFIISLVSVLLTSTAYGAENEAPTRKRSHSKKTNSAKTGLDELTASTYKLMTESSDLMFGARFLVQMTEVEKQRTKLSASLAMKHYHTALEESSAYRKFCQSYKAADNWHQIPIMTKDNYVKVFEPKDRVRGGKIKPGTTWDTSSGSTGTPTLWPRDAKERAHVKKRLKIALDLGLPGKKVTLINGFALGQWATGTTIAGLNLEGVNKINAGDNPKTWIAQIRTLGDLDGGCEKNPKHVFVLATYPPFLNKLVDLLDNDPNYEDIGGAKIFLSKYPIHAITGGEGIVEKNRQNLLDLGFKKIWSTYGASDLSINIGAETDFEREVRKLLDSNVALRKKLFGAEKGVRDAPMVFHYDPLEFYIEENLDTGNLLYTCMNEKYEPRIKYDLKDQGAVMMYSDVVQFLSNNGYVDNHYKSKINLPLLFIWDRGENGVTFLGSNLYPANLINVIEGNLSVKNKVQHIAYHQYVLGDQNYLDILVELKRNVELDDSKRAALHAEIIQGLKNGNEDFKGIQEKQDKVPGIKFYAHETGPMHDWASRQGSKLKYVFRGDEVKNRML